MSHVFICRAHSRSEPGFSIPGEPELNEWFLSEEFCWGAAEMFKETGHRFDVLGSSLGLRIGHIKAYCRNHPCEQVVAIEMHCNQMPGRPMQRGWFLMAWYSSEEAIKMSEAIVEQVKGFNHTRYRGINRVSHTHRWIGNKWEYPDEPVGFLENIPCPTLILESGYLSNKKDADWLRQPGNRYALGQAVGRGILNYLEEK